MAQRRDRVEWPTLLLLVSCYAAWALGVLWLAPLSLPAAIGLTALACALHASLQHEIIHGHPFGRPRLDALLVWPALGLLIPFGRFRDTHLAHHTDASLTDPYDDPETNYLDPAVWARLPPPVRAILRLNNTLAGRVLLGPVVAWVAFAAADWRAMRFGAPETREAVRRAWLAHLPAAGLVLAVVAAASMPMWSYLAAAYLGHAILKIRTFLEHQAHEHSAARTVIIEDRGPLALIFLNNNLHVVHHMHPGVAWYRLPALYLANRARYLARNRGYVYRSYAEVFRRHFWRAKDPVPHPLWPAPVQAPSGARAPAAECPAPPPAAKPVALAGRTDIAPLGGPRTASQPA